MSLKYEPASEPLHTHITEKLEDKVTIKVLDPTPNCLLLFYSRYRS